MPPKSALVVAISLAFMLFYPPGASPRAQATASEVIGAAAEEATEAPTEPESGSESTPAVVGRRYLVEVIVFDYHGPIPSGGELWDRAPPIDFKPEWFKAGVPDRGSNVVPASVEYRDLKALLPVLSKLNARSQYEVITYTAWTQPLFGKSNSIPVPIVPPASVQTAGEIDPFERASLEGTLRMFESRLLFVEIDLKNRRGADVRYATGAQPAAPPRTFYLHEQRRVKLNEIHYFDHPYFGALVRVSRWEPTG